MRSLPLAATGPAPRAARVRAARYHLAARPPRLRRSRPAATIRRMRRALICLAALAMVLVAAATASAHPELLSTSPSADTRRATSPPVGHDPVQRAGGVAAHRERQRG